MATVFSPSAIKRLESLFGVRGKSMGTNYRFEIAAQESGGAAVRRLALEIYPDIRIGRKKGNLQFDFLTSWLLNLCFIITPKMSENDSFIAPDWFS